MPARRTRVLVVGLAAALGLLAIATRHDACDHLAALPRSVVLPAFDAGPPRPARASAGCSASPAVPADGALARTLSDGTELRTYQIVLPAHYDPRRPYPLVLSFHGSGGNGDGFRRSMHEAGALEAIVLFPDAVVRRVWGEHFATHWGKTEDLPFFDALVATTRATFCVDEARVFAWGWSSGGYFANQLGCVRPDVVRAIVALSGGGPENVTCQTPMAAFIHHDRNDGSVAFATGSESRDHWRAVNRCDGARATENGCTVFDGCQQPLVWCATRGNGHGVPPSVRDAAWAFLRRF